MVFTMGDDFFAGWVAGMTGVCAGHPLDTIKVLQQVNSTGMMDTVRRLYRQGGIRPFFSGMTPPLVTTGLLNSIFFGVYGYSIQFFTTRGDPPTFYMTHFLAGCIAGTAQLLVGCPVDVVKIQMQTNCRKHSSELRGVWNCIANILKLSGIFGLYKGLISHALRDIPSSGVYFVVYEYSKITLASKRNESNRVHFVAGGLAGVLSWWSTLPLDVIKSRLQADSGLRHKSEGILHVVSQILKKDGLAGLFHGFWPLSFRAFVVNGVIFLVYEHF